MRLTQDQEECLFPTARVENLRIKGLLGRVSTQKGFGSVVGNN